MESPGQLSVKINNRPVPRPIAVFLYFEIAEVGRARRAMPSVSRTDKTSPTVWMAIHGTKTSLSSTRSDPWSVHEVGRD